MPRQRWAWLLLFFSAFCLEATALFFQHGMDLQPCIMCIYERCAMLMLIAAGLFGAINPQAVFFRLLGFTTWFTGAVWGLLLAIEHVDLQLNPSPFNTCDLEPNFPEWLPLHHWLPAVFEATGYCGEIVWTFLGYSMVQWILAVFAVYTGLAIIVFVFHLPKLFKS
jgi:disulfide bond formation protein DsbB